MTVLSST